MLGYAGLFKYADLDFACSEQLRKTRVCSLNQYAYLH